MIETLLFKLTLDIFCMCADLRPVLRIRPRRVKITYLVTI